LAPAKNIKDQNLREIIKCHWQKLNKILNKICDLEDREIVNTWQQWQCYIDWIYEEVKIKAEMINKEVGVVLKNELENLSVFKELNMSIDSIIGGLQKLGYIDISESGNLLLLRKEEINNYTNIKGKKIKILEEIRRKAVKKKVKVVTSTDLLDL